MNYKTKKKTWIPIVEFLKITGLKMSQVYKYKTRRVWPDGCIVKKSPTGRYAMACLEDYHQWLGL